MAIATSPSPSIHDIPAQPGQYWQWRGHQIYYVQAGAPVPGRPPLLLVHGFGASTDHWRKNLAELQHHFSVWAIDLLGFGRSEKAVVEYSGDLWRSQLADFITEVIGEPTVLAGNSLGGYASLCVAGGNPELAKGLVLLNSAGPFSDQAPPKPSILKTTIRKLLLESAFTYVLFQYLRNRAIIRRTLKKVYLDHRAVTDQLVEDIYRPSCDRGAAQVFASVFKNPQGEKVDHLLKNMTCPLLMLWGEGDPWMRVRVRSEKFRQHKPDLQEHFLQAGHCPHDEIPQEVNRLIQDWILSQVHSGN